MAIRLNTDGSKVITDPMLLSFQNQKEVACMELQKHLDEGFHSLTEAVRKIDRFTEKVRNTVKKYQQDKQCVIAPKKLYAKYEEFLEEHQGYKKIHLKAVILIENTKQTIQFIQPAHRSRSDEKSFQDSHPLFYAELKESEMMFSNYVNQFTKTQSIISTLKHQLHAAINGKGLKTALEKLHHIVENQRDPPSRSHQPTSHIATKRLSISPLYQVTDPSRISAPSFESLSSSSPRREMLTSPREITRLSPPKKRSAMSSPRNTQLQLRSRDALRSSRGIAYREPFTHLSNSEGSSSYYEKSPRTYYAPTDSPSRTQYTKLSGSGEPTVSTDPSNRDRKTHYVPNWDRKKYEMDTPALQSERGRKPYREELNHVRSKKTYDYVGASPYTYSGSRY